MGTASGAACPMHEASGVADRHAGHGTPAPVDDRTCCVMRGTCDGPPLFTLLAQPGVLASPMPAVAPAAVAWVAPSTRESAVSLTVPPDAPPPRS